jgi:serine/threonine protein kinase
MPNLIGKSIDRYHILEQLGEGGMATVYKAYDTRLERDVAIKIIRKKAFPEEQLDRILKRFEREAKALARLSHPNIIKVIDYGEYEGSPYLVVEYFPGGTLKQRLGKPMPWQDAVRLLIPIAEALEYAHEQKIIHRDIKPSNILLMQKGQPMLTDFGIAKMLEVEDAATLTGTGVGVGTPEYMAPEQWTGSATAQSDIYSLGVVLYEMITGRKPYTADTPAAILLKQATEPLPRPNSYVSDLPDSIEKVLLKALARNPKDRYQDAGALIEGLENLLTGTNKSKNSIAMPKRESKPVEPDLDTQDTYLQGETYATSLETKTYSETPLKPKPAQLKPANREENKVIPLILKWRSVLWIVLGCSIGWVIGIETSKVINSVIISGTIIGSVSGFTIAFVLQKEGLFSEWKDVFLITLGWTIGWVIGKFFIIDHNSFVSIIPGSITGLNWFWVHSDDLHGLISIIPGTITSGSIGGFATALVILKIIMTLRLRKEQV